MLIINEQMCCEVIGNKDAFTAVERVFAAMAKGEAHNFPIVREAIGHADALFGFKSGFDRAQGILGLKAGGYWPGNEKRGLTNHQSTVFLFHPDTGQPIAMVSGNYLTAIRTAAASAISIAYLAREDAAVLGMVGAGYQSAFQMRAALGQRRFERVVGWNRNPEMLSRLGEVATEVGLPFEAVELERLGAEADVIITTTSSFAPILKREHVRPGTHLACMGADTRGKQEVETEILATALVFTDEVGQAAVLGECQHAVGDGLIEVSDITPIGAVINGTHSGRTSDDEITLFDGTGVALQDLALASAVAHRRASNS